MTNARTKLENEYKTENGRITSPGKFESEMIYIPYFWELTLQGEYDELDSNKDDEYLYYVILPVKEDYELFPELEGITKLTLWERTDGFVMSSTE